MTDEVIFDEPNTDLQIYSTGMPGSGGGGGGSGVWGQITGTLSNQADLQAALNLKANTSSLAAVALSGAYADLSGKPAIPTLLSQLTNDTGFITSSALSPYLTSATAAATYATIANLNLKAPLASPTFTGTVSGITAAMVGAPSGSGSSTGTNTGDQTNISGNAGTVTTINGRISAGTNVTLGGTGTAADPYVINSSGGGGSGDVAGPASATDNAVARFDATTGKLIQNSGVIIDDSNNISGLGTVASAATVITSNSAAALVIGANGATNPAFSVDASAASAATGIAITAGAAGSGVTLSATSSAADEILVITSKGSAELQLNAGSVGANALRLRTGGTNRVIVSGSSITYANTNQHLFSTSSLSTAGSVRFSFVQPAETNLTAGTEAPSVFFNLTANRSHAGNTAITLQRDFRIAGSTHAFAAAGGVITDLAALAITPPVGGTNATATNNSAILVQSAAVGNCTNGYGINIAAPTGATNNYAARLEGSAGELLRVRTDGQLALLATNTASGTTGAQTINRPSGTVNFAAGASSLVVTNSLCTTSSIVFAVVRTNDATAVIKNVVPAAGSFTITLNAAATAETSVGFFVIN